MRSAILVAAVLLAACGSEEPAAPEAAQFALQPLGAPEMQQYDIALTGCAFVPAGGGLGSLFITDGDKAYLKTNGSVAPLAKLGEDYAGGGYSASLKRSGEGRKRGSQADYSAHLTVRDGRDAVIYDAEGMARCSA